MTKLLAAIDEKYGGVEAYVKNDLGFSSEDVANIRTNLTK